MVRLKPDATYRFAAPAECLSVFGS